MLHVRVDGDMDWTTHLWECWHQSQVHGSEWRWGCKGMSGFGCIAQRELGQERCTVHSARDIVTCTFLILHAIPILLWHWGRCRCSLAAFDVVLSCMRWFSSTEVTWQNQPTQPSARHSGDARNTYHCAPPPPPSPNDNIWATSGGRGSGLGMGTFGGVRQQHEGHRIGGDGYRIQAASRGAGSAATGSSTSGAQRMAAAAVYVGSRHPRWRHGYEYLLSKWILKPTEVRCCLPAHWPWDIEL